MSLPFETRTYHLRGLTPLMGGQPASAEIRSKWIGSKAPTPELIEAEAEAKLPCVDEEQGFTVFCRDPKNGNLTLMDYQVRGLIKGCLEGMQGVNGIAQPRAKVDKYVMVLERYIPLTRVTGETGVKTVDGFFVELKDLNVLGSCAVQQCIMCNLDKQDQRRCPLQKVMDKIPIPKADYDDEDGCPYQWVKIPEVSE